MSSYITVIVIWIILYLKIYFLILELNFIPIYTTFNLYLVISYNIRILTKNCHHCNLIWFFTPFNLANKNICRSTYRKPSLKSFYTLCVSIGNAIDKIYLYIYNGHMKNEFDKLFTTFKTIHTHTLVRLYFVPRRDSHQFKILFAIGTRISLYIWKCIFCVSIYIFRR